MRIPFPERIPLPRVALFCAALFVVQQLEGTTLSFSLSTALFIFIGTAAFNTAGGMTRASGGFIFSYMVLAGLFGILYKALLGEAGHTNLLRPDRTIQVYVGTVAAMFAAAYLARKFTPKKPLFALFKSDEQLRLAALGCTYTGIGITLLAMFGSIGAGSGSLLSIIYQLNAFLPLSVILGVTYEVRSSGGRRSFNIQILISCLSMLAMGILSYSKQAMFASLACWFLPAVAQRVRMSIAHIAGLVLAFGLMSYYLVPYSQIGRSFHSDTATFGENLKSNIYLLENLDKVRTANVTEDLRLAETEENAFRYYNKPQGFADRLQMLSPDDALIKVTDEGTVFGIYPTIFAFENIIPHFIWHNKPAYLFGNIYAHEAGILIDEDNTGTGISFSPSGEAYHQAKWLGVLVMLPILLFMLFLITDACCGDTRESPFALLALSFFLHTAPEGGVTSIVFEMTMGILMFFVASVVSTKIMPLVASLFAGSSKRNEALLQAAAARAVPAPVPHTEVAAVPYRWSRPKAAE